MILFSLIASLLLSGAEASAQSRCSNCNVVVVSLDTVGAARLGVYDSSKKTTPHLDELAKTARVYDAAFAPSSWTLPSHAAMLTGFAPTSLKIWSMTDRIPVGAPTLASVLKKNGYVTAAFTGGVFVAKEYGFDQGFDRFEVASELAWDPKHRDRNPFDRAVDWLKKPSEKPFFLFVHSYRAHEPYRPSRESLDALDPSGKRRISEASLETLLKHQLGKSVLKDDAARDLGLLYEAAILDVDRELGKLVTALKERRLDLNTIIVVTSDHGQEFGEHGCQSCHGHSVYDEVTRVPLVVKVPQQPGKKLSSPVALMDIVPTLFQLLGLAGPVEMDGRVLPVTDTKETLERVVISQSPGATEARPVQQELLSRLEKNQSAIGLLKPGHDGEFVPFRATTSGVFAARSAKFKLVVDHSAASFTLYDLESDPRELKNVADKNQAVVSELKSKLILGR